MEDSSFHDDLEQMAGSRATARQVEASLRRLADGSAGTELAEMAREVLDGRTSLRAVARSSAYADQMIKAIGRFQRWHAGLTPEQRNKFLEDTRRHLDQQD